MKPRRARVLVVWLGCIAFAIIVVARAHYITDLSAFLPAHPTPTQQLLVDQLRDGPASRLILFAIEGGDAAARARISSGLVQRLRKDTEFLSINNGAELDGQADREFLFQHRYLLSDAVDAQRFSAAGLNAAISETIDNLASPAGLLFKSLLPRDPTGELLNIIDQLARSPAPQSRDGVWVSGDGKRALAVAQTRASGSDSDAQGRAIEAIRAAFAAAAHAAASSSGGAAAVQLRLSGPAVFAVAARAKIESAALRLSIASGVLVVALLLLVYRSLPALGLGLLPVATGALVGIGAVALGFGAVHGITLGFGVTLIGESVDYSIYFFMQSPPGAGGRPRLAAAVVADDTPGNADVRVRIRFAAAVRISRTQAVGALLHQRLDRGCDGDPLCIAGLAAGRLHDSRCNAAWTARRRFLAGCATLKRPRYFAVRGGSRSLRPGSAVSRSCIPLESRVVGVEPDLERSTEL